MDRYTQWGVSGIVAAVMIAAAMYFFRSQLRESHVIGSFFLFGGLLSLLAHVNLMVGLAVNQ